MAIHAPKCFWEDLTPKWGTVSLWPAKGTSLPRNTWYDVQIIKISPPVRAGHEPKNVVKRKKVDLRNRNVWQVTCSPRPPKLSHCHMDLRVWSYLRRSYNVIYSKFRQNPFGGFGAMGSGSKFGYSHYFGYWLLQKLILPYKPLYTIQAVITLTTFSF